MSENGFYAFIFEWWFQCDFFYLKFWCFKHVIILSSGLYCFLWVVIHQSYCSKYNATFFWLLSTFFFLFLFILTYVLVNWHWFSLVLFSLYLFNWRLLSFLNLWVDIFHQFGKSSTSIALFPHYPFMISSIPLLKHILRHISQKHCSLSMLIIYFIWFGLIICWLASPSFILCSAPFSLLLSYWIVHFWYYVFLLLLGFLG